MVAASTTTPWMSGRAAKAWRSANGAPARREESVRITVRAAPGLPSPVSRPAKVSSGCSQLPPVVVTEIWKGSPGAAAPLRPWTRT